jgi:hypothetical protein
VGTVELGDDIDTAVEVGEVGDISGEVTPRAGDTTIVEVLSSHSTSPV